MVNEKEIEANLENIWALVNMAPPQSIRQIQQLNEKVFALSIFIARAAKRCLPFFRFLKGNKEFKWSKECDHAFKQLKEYLGRPPLLTSPILGEHLYIYLTISDLAVTAVLFREEERVE